MSFDPPRALLEREAPKAACTSEMVYRGRVLVHVKTAMLADARAGTRESDALTCNPRSRKGNGADGTLGYLFERRKLVPLRRSERSGSLITRFGSLHRARTITRCEVDDGSGGADLDAVTVIVTALGKPVWSPDMGAERMCWAGTDAGTTAGTPGIDADQRAPW